MVVRVGKIGFFRPIYRYVSETVQDKDIVTVEGIGTPMCFIDWCDFY